MNLPDNCYVYRPEQAKPITVDVCSECGSYITEGDQYYELYGKAYCEDCMEEHKKEAELEY